jgi:hypothetical protein
MKVKGKCPTGRPRSRWEQVKEEVTQKKELGKKLRTRSCGKMGGKA